MKLEELLRVAIGAVVIIEIKAEGQTPQGAASAETFLRNLKEETKSREVTKVWTWRNCLHVMIADESEEKQNGTQKSGTEN